LLAKALCLAMTMVDVPASSRASALLQMLRLTPIMRPPEIDYRNSRRQSCGWRKSIVGARLPANAMSNATLPALRHAVYLRPKSCNQSFMLPGSSSSCRARELAV
jgi:hypothetical protein